MTNHKGITRSAPPEGHRGGVQGGEITTYNLRKMNPELIEALGLTRYLKERTEEIGK